jgi:hypothetical protein
MTTVATQSVWQQARKAFDGLLASLETPAPSRDRWAGRRFTILSQSGETIEVSDARGRPETIALPYGAVQTIEDFVSAHALPNADGLTLAREPFELEGLTFWRWTVGF